MGNVMKMFVLLGVCLHTAHGQGNSPPGAQLVVPTMPLTNLTSADRDVMIQIRTALPSLAPLMVGDNPCAWFNASQPFLPPFIACDTVDGVTRVTSINFEALNAASITATGAVPFNLIMELDALTSIYLQDSGPEGLTGTLPPNWKSAKLEVIWLSNNSFTGTLPSEYGFIGVMPKLATFVGAGNKFNGSLPSWGAGQNSMPALQQLIVNNNSITGTIPATLAGLPGLVQLNAAANNLSGPLPDAFGAVDAFGSLTSLELDSNNLEGPLPASWGTVGAFQRDGPGSTQQTQREPVNLSLSYNSRLSGSIPASWTNLGTSSAVATVYLLPGTSVCGPAPANVEVSDSMSNNLTSLPSCMAAGGRKMML